MKDVDAMQTDVNGREQPTVVVTAEAILLRGRDAAAVCGFSARHWRRLHDAGRTPPAVKIGRSLRWRLSVLRRWEELDCPARDAFRAIVSKSGATSGGRAARNRDRSGG